MPAIRLSLSSFALLLAACTPAPQREASAPKTGPAPPASIQENTGAPPEAGPWYWVAATRGSEIAAVREPARYQIELAGDGVMQLRADCNRGRASYSAGEDGSFSAGPAGLSKMGCPADSQDRAFVAALGAARRWQADGNWLRLSGDTGDALFSRDAAVLPQVYDCEQGAPFAAVSGDGNVALLVDGGWQVLPDVPAASGTRHAAGGREFGSKGDQAYLEGPAPRQDCRSRG